MTTYLIISTYNGAVVHRSENFAEVAAVFATGQILRAVRDGQVYEFSRDGWRARSVSVQPLPVDDTEPPL